MALEKEVASKVAAAQPTHVPQQQGGAQYIRYTPSQQGVSFNSGAKQRVIRMVEAQKDPMEPPRFKYVLFAVIFIKQKIQLNVITERSVDHSYRKCD